MNARESQTRDRPASRLRYQPLVAVATAAALGILVDRAHPLPVWGWWLAFLFGWAAWCGLWRLRADRSAAVTLLLAIGATAAAWHHCQWHLFSRNDLGLCAKVKPQPVCIEAVVLQAPRQTPPAAPDPLRIFTPGVRSRADVLVTRVRDGRAWRAAAGRVGLYIEGQFEPMARGDRLVVFGQLSAPDEKANPGAFDVRRYLRADRRLCSVKVPHIEGVSRIDEGSRWAPGRWIDAARGHGQRLFQQYLGRERQGLGEAVLLGSREQLDPEVTEAFLETGTIHLLVVSGLNVAMLVAALWFVLRRTRLPRSWCMAIVAGTVIFYFLLTGAEPPITRATILVLGACLGMVFGRESLPFNVLAAAALLVLAINPADLFSVGAQLSFLCVACLASVSDRWRPTEERDALEQLIAATRSWPSRFVHATGRFLAELTLTGTVLWLLILPLVMARFHVVASVAPLMNTVMWLPVEVAMISGFALLVFGFIAPLGAFLGFVCDHSLWVMHAAVAATRDMPGSHFWAPGPPDWWLWGFYGALGLGLAIPQLRPPRRWCWALLAGWSGLGFGASIWQHQPAGLQCTVLSVGHGCATVLQLPSGRTVLYDAGQLAAPRAASRTVAACLWERGITRLDAVILSHPDTDHYNALPDLLDQFSVGTVYVTPLMFSHPSRALDVLQAAAGRAGVPVRELHAGQLLSGGAGCQLKVLHPPATGVPGSDNANSLVLAAEYQGRRILLPGDLDSPGLENLLAEEPLHCDVLLAPHHGSRRSHSPDLMQWCRPRWMIVSGGLHEETETSPALIEAAGCRYLHTAHDGAVSVRIEGESIQVQGFLGAR